MTKEEAIAILREDGFKLLGFSDELKNDKDVVLAAIQYSWSTLAFASEFLKNDEDVVLLAIKDDGYALQDASPELKNNKSVVMHAVRQHGLSLKYASNELKNDYDIVLAAVETDEQALQYAGDITKNNMAIILSSLYPTCVAKKYIERSLCDRPEIKFMMANGIYISKSDWPLIKRALLERPDYFLNPEPYMKALVDGMAYSYLMLAQYALSKDAIIEPEPYPGINLI